ncbi:MAG: hypothetical protein ACP5G8_07065, partial [Athalassotoga sp.]
MGIKSNDNKDKIIQEIKKNNQIFVVGCKYVGKTYFKNELISEGELDSNSCVDISDASVQDELLNLKQKLSKDEKTVAFMNHSFKDYFINSNKSKDYTNIKYINYSVEKDEAERFFDLYTDRIQDDKLRSWIKKQKGRIIDDKNNIFAFFKDPREDYKTYVPGVIQDHIGILENEYKKGNFKSSVSDYEIEKYMNQTLDRKTGIIVLFETMVLPEEIIGRNLFVNVSSTVGSVLSAIPGPVQIAGLAALGGAGIVSFLMLLKNKTPKNLFTDIGRAKQYWDELETETQKKWLCYKIERHYSLEPGSLYLILENLFMNPHKFSKDLDEFLTFYKQHSSDFQKIIDLINSNQIEEWKKEQDRRLTELENRVKQIEKELENIKKEISEMKDKIRKIEVEVQKFESSPIMISESTNILSCQQLSNRPFFTNSSINSEIQKIISYVKGKNSVKIVGEMGIGKSTILCKAIEELIREKYHVYYGGTKDLTDGVFVLDNMIPDDVEIINTLRRNNIVTIVTVRDEYENDKGINKVTKDFKTVRITPELYDNETLKKILISNLKNNGISFDEGALDTVVKNSKGLPVYVAGMADYLKNMKIKTLTVNEAINVPPNIYELIAKIILNAKEEEIILLYALSLTTGYMHLVQLNILAKKLNVQQTSVKNMLNENNYIYSLKHDSWKDMLQKRWADLGVSDEEPDVLLELRNNIEIKEIIKDSLIESVNSLNLDNEDHYKIAMISKIALENRETFHMDNLVNDIFDKGIKSKNISEVFERLSIYANSEFKNRLQELKTEELEEISNRISNAPNAEIAIYNILIERYEKSEGSTHLEPDLARNFGNRGIAFDDMHDLDRAISDYNQAIQIYQKLIDAGNTHLEPNLARNFGNRGNAFDDMHDLDRAISDYNQAIQIYQKLIDAGNT